MIKRILYTILSLFLGLGAVAQAPTVSLTTRSSYGAPLPYSVQDSNLSSTQNQLNAADRQWGWNQASSSGLVFAFYGGAAWDGTKVVTVGNGTITLPASSVSYVERTAAGVVSSNTSQFTPAKFPIAIVTTSAGAITNVVNARLPYSAAGAAGGLTSFNGRTGAIVPIAGDYTFSLVTGTNPLSKGGTAADLSLTGGTGQVLQQATVGGAVTVGLVSAANLTGTLAVAHGGTGATTALGSFDALAPTTTRGDLTYRGATTSLRLPLGTSGYVLTSNGTDPVWAVSPSAPVTNFNGRTGAISPSSGDYSVGMVTGAASSSALAASTGTTGAQLIGFKQSGTGTISLTVDQKLKQIWNASDWGAVLDGTTDNTTVVQAMCDAVSTFGGGVVIVPRKCKWTPATLTWDANVDIVDESTSDYRKTILNGGNVGGAVNEFQIEAGFHPGLILNVFNNRTLTTLGAGQVYSNRESIIYRVNDVGKWQIANDINAIEQNDLTFYRLGGSFQMLTLQADGKNTYGQMASGGLWSADYSHNFRGGSTCFENSSGDITTIWRLHDNSKRKILTFDTSADQLSIANTANTQVIFNLTDAGVFKVPSLDSSVAATTQSANDNSTKLATTAYVDGKTSFSGGLTLGATSSITATSTGNLSLSVINNSNGTGASASTLAQNDVGTIGRVNSYSSGNTSTVFGLTPANYVLFGGSGSSLAGVLIGQTQSASLPVIFGLGSVEAGRFTSGTLATGTFDIKYTADSTSTTSAASGRFAGGLSVAKRIDAASVFTTGVVTATGAVTGSNLSGTNTGDATLSGQNYLTLSGQAFTANAVDLSGTNATGTLAAARFPALTGDVTTSAGAVATTIGSNKVTNSMLAQGAAYTIKGNNTNATANEADLALIPTQDQADPSAPTTAYGNLYSRTEAGRSMARYFGGANGTAYTLQPWLGAVQVSRWMYNGSTSITTTGVSSTTTSGTLAAAAPVTTNYQTQWQRLKNSGTTAANNGPCEMFTANGALGTFWRGTAARQGGFMVVMDFSSTTANTASTSAFFGVDESVTQFGSAEPSAQTDIFGMGYDSTDSSSGNWQFMRNDGTGTATKVDLGSNAPRDATTVYREIISCLPNDSVMYVKIINMTTDTVVLDTSYSSDLPTNTGLMAGRFEMNARASGVAQVILWGTNMLYVEVPTR